MSFLVFYKKWFKILFLGWWRIIYIIYKFLKELFILFPVSLWGLYIVSLGLLVFVVIPWFQYQIQLDQIEIESIRSKRWYFFILPAITSFVIPFLPYRSFYYSIQLAINIMILLFFLYGFFNIKIHILIQGNYEISYVFYLYFIVLIFHSILIVSFKKPENFISYHIAKLWNEKIKNLY